VVFISKTGTGKAFVDDISLVGVVKGMEPKLPGFAPVVPKKPAKPVLPRHTKPLLAPAATGANKYPGSAAPVMETPGRNKAEGPECQAWVSHSGDVLHVKVLVRLHRPLVADSAPEWTQTDGAEVCFSYPDNNAQHPTFVLHGFPNGAHESSTEAGAPAAIADTLRKAVRFTAKVEGTQWTGEWDIPLSAVDIEAPVGLELNFNIGIFRSEPGQWIQWAGTGSQTWLVERAGRVCLAK